MDLTQLWNLFLKTGSPEAYLVYKQECRRQAEEIN